jgi:hypothetical protein
MCTCKPLLLSSSALSPPPFAHPAPFFFARASLSPRRAICLRVPLSPRRAMHAYADSQITRPNPFSITHFRSPNYILNNPHTIDQQSQIPDLRICVEFVSIEKSAGDHLVVGPFSIASHAEFKRRYTAISTATFGRVWGFRLILHPRTLPAPPPMVVGMEFDTGDALLPFEFYPHPMDP